MPVISNASTRAMVIDSMGRGRYTQPIQVSKRGQYWRRRRGARLTDVCGGPVQQLARINGPLAAFSRRRVCWDLGLYVARPDLFLLKTRAGGRSVARLLLCVVRRHAPAPPPPPPCPTAPFSTYYAAQCLSISTRQDLLLLLSSPIT
jgi:hypothetical protein